MNSFKSYVFFDDHCEVHNSESVTLYNGRVVETLYADVIPLFDKLGISTDVILIARVGEYIKFNKILDGITVDYSFVDGRLVYKLICNGNFCTFGLEFVKDKDKVTEMAADVREKDIRRYHIIRSSVVVPNDEIFTIKQAAVYLGVKPETLYNWNHHKKIKYSQIGRSVRYRKIDLDEKLKKK